MVSSPLKFHPLSAGEGLVRMADAKMLSQMRNPQMYDADQFVCKLRRGRALFLPPTRPA